MTGNEVVDLWGGVMDRLFGLQNYMDGKVALLEVRLVTLEKQLEEPKPKPRNGIASHRRPEQALTTSERLRMMREGRVD
jgi:hypothetical protein